MEPRKYATVRELPKYYPIFTVSSIRHLFITNERDIKGKCTIRVGKRILFDLEKFQAWLDEGNQDGGC